ncbi:MAG: hypothetical protein JWO69_425 [Thermoleophilia bacterium]|jgi:prepilin-type N-terminal cleavage/methylation domain-containing protein|nr:hypothetical protein [Thermoleophilia bacterium]
MHARPHRAGADGFTLIEVIIVMVILAIMLTITIGAFRSGRDSSSTSKVVAAGTSYADAIEQFGTDARGRYPEGIGSQDWPVATEGPRSALARGNGRYLRSIPEAVQDKLVGVGAAGPDGHLLYVPRPDRTGYELRVIDRNGAYRCSFAKNVTAAGQKDCALG